MEFKQLKEMPRFWVSYGIKFYNEEKRSQILNLFNEIHVDQSEFICIVDQQEDETFSIGIEFKECLFCGFSVSDAIKHLFGYSNVLTTFETIIRMFENDIKKINLSLECYDNPLAERFYMHTDIVGDAAKIIHKLHCEIYFDVGKDALRGYSDYEKVCKILANIEDKNMQNYEIALKAIKSSIKQRMKEKEKILKKSFF